MLYLNVNPRPGCIVKRDPVDSTFDYAEWFFKWRRIRQRVGDQIDAAFITTRADFVNVL